MMQLIKLKLVNVMRLFSMDMQILFLELYITKDINY